jgi:hypothetical protein
MHRKTAVLTVAALAAFAAWAQAESGDYELEIPLAAMSPAGEFPIHIETPTFLVDGTIRIELGAGGRLTATAAFPGREVTFAGRFSAARGGERIALKMPARGGARLTGSLQGTQFTGSFVDDGSLVRGTGTFTIDVSSAHPLVASVAASAHGGFGRLRRGIGEATAEGVATFLGVDVASGPITVLRARGAAFRFAAQGALTESDLTVTAWRATAYGATATGTTLAATFDPVPDISLLLVNGDAHEAAPGAEPADLSRDAGPFLAHLLGHRGLEVTTAVFADADEDEENPGYSGMVTKLNELRGTLVLGRVFPTRIVVVTLGHGAVRAHAAIRDVPDAPITALIDLDATVCGWAEQGHDTDAIGGDPVGAVSIFDVTFDLVDVVFGNVLTSLDVHSASNCPDSLTGGGDPVAYDVPVHRRPDGTVEGFHYYFTTTTHDELHDVFGTTLPKVGRWLTTLLAPRAKR